MKITKFQKMSKNWEIDTVLAEAQINGATHLCLKSLKLVKIEPDTPASEPSKKEPEEVSEKYTKEDLEKLKMSELREIGNKFGASDTKKSELIEEIIEKQN